MREHPMVDQGLPGHVPPTTYGMHAGDSGHPASCKCLYSHCDTRDNNCCDKVRDRHLTTGDPNDDKKSEKDHPDKEATSSGDSREIQVPRYRYVRQKGGPRIMHPKTDLGWSNTVMPMQPTSTVHSMREPSIGSSTRSIPTHSILGLTTTHRTA